MKNYVIVLLILLNVVYSSHAQQQTTTIKQMSWGSDYQVYMQTNDTAYNLQIEELFHANPEEIFNQPTTFYYYPVNFEQSYIDSLMNLNGNDEYTVNIQREPKVRKLTLWGVVGQSVGGGWVHFVNCLVYALESRKLELTAPLLKRPESSWKPNPMTESFKRTHKWTYYAPVLQKEAKKEYKIRKKKNQLGDLKSIPQTYIDLMLNTSDKEYIKLLEKRNFSQLARIDLVKLMLGAPYMSETQIDFINSRVMQSIANYNKRRMPTVLIFDKYDAAVAMTLDGLGYKAEKIVYKNEQNLSAEEIRQRTIIINGIIALINEQNSKAFKENLQGIYKPKE
jgi:hypothetical protein